jgi:hypothetical protein
MTLRERAPDLAGGSAWSAKAPPPLDLEQIRLHVIAIHERAAPLAGKGVLIVAAYGENPATGKEIAPQVRHIQIGDIEANVRTVAEFAKVRFANVYMPLHVMRNGLGPKQRGTAEDIVAVLGLIADLDWADGKTDKEFPLDPAFVIESSPGNFQPGIFFDCPLEPDAARRIAEAISRAVGGDSATKDIAHVWRVPGALNWPNRKKINEYGRSPEPFLVRFKEPFEGLVYDPATGLGRIALPEPPETLRKTETDPGAQNAERPPLTPEIMAAILKHLVARNFFQKEYSGVVTGADGRIKQVGWLECGMALKLATATRARNCGR